MKRITVGLCCIFFALITIAPVWAQNDPPKKAGTSAEAPAQANLSDGEVRKIDMDAKKITVKHGPLANLDMPAMTMVFQVKDTAMLDKVKAGDKVKFLAEKQSGAFTIMHIEPVK